MALGGKPNSSVKTAHGHERRARAEDRQRVEQCDEKGEQQGIALAHEEKADKKL